MASIQFFELCFSCVLVRSALGKKKKEIVAICTKYNASFLPFEDNFPFFH